MISDDRLNEYACIDVGLIKYNADVVDMARELLALRKAFSEPVAWNNFRWVETPKNGWHWSLYESCKRDPKIMDGWASLPMFYRHGYESLMPPTDSTT